MVSVMVKPVITGYNWFGYNRLAHGLTLCVSAMALALLAFSCSVMVPPDEFSLCDTRASKTSAELVNTRNYCRLRHIAYSLT